MVNLICPARSVGRGARPGTLEALVLFPVFERGLSHPLLEQLGEVERIVYSRGSPDLSDRLSGRGEQFTGPVHPALVDPLNGRHPAVGLEKGRDPLGYHLIR